MTAGAPDTIKAAGGYAVIFTSVRTEQEDDTYAETTRRMLSLASQQPGFLGVESVRDADGFGITVSYWKGREAIAAWKHNIEHREARAQGRARWYQRFTVRICKVEKEYAFS